MDSCRMDLLKKYALSKRLSELHVCISYHADAIHNVIPHDIMH